MSRPRKRNCVVGSDIEYDSIERRLRGVNLLVDRGVVPFVVVALREAQMPHASREEFTHLLANCTTTVGRDVWLFARTIDVFALRVKKSSRGSERTTMRIPHCC